MEREHSPLLLKYLKNHVNHPESKAFAPLAEAYRKIGQTDKSLDLLRQGLKKHPNYVSAIITLARCHCDTERFDLAYTALKPFVGQNIENILFLKVFALACEKTNRNEEAKQAYKYLLFLNPRDEFYAERVKELDCEEVIEESSDENIDEDAKEDLSEIDQWEAKAFFSPEESVLPRQPTNIGPVEHEPANPVMTLTLVDLYCDQGVFEKAKEVLEHILELHPNDENVLKRLAKVQEGLGESVDEGRNNLMSIIDEKLAESAQNTKSENPGLQKVEFYYRKFLQNIKLRSHENLASL